MSEQWCKQYVRRAFIVFIFLIVCMFLAGVVMAETASDRSRFEAMSVTGDGVVQGVVLVPVLSADGATRRFDSTTPVTMSVSGIAAAVSITESTIPVTPMSIALAVDTSGSMRRRLASAKAGLTAFVDKLPRDSRLALFSFNDLAFTAVRFGSSRADIDRGINGLMFGGRVTVLYDAIMRALDDLSREQTERRILLVISDGKDENSSTTLSACLTRAESLAIPIYTIGLGVRKEDEAALREIAYRSGSDFCLSPDRDSQKLAACFDAVVAGLPPPMVRLVVEGTAGKPVSAVGTTADVVMTLGDADREVIVRKTVTIEAAARQSVQSGPRTVLTLGAERETGGAGFFAGLPPKYIAIAGIALLLLAMIIFIIVYRRRGVAKRSCPLCGEVIPDYLEDCLACSGTESDDADDKRRKRERLSKQLVDTSPMIHALDDRLDQTLVLMEIPSLIHFRGNEVLATYDMTIMHELEVGRGQDCAIVIRDSSVSTRHARLIREDDEYYIVDLGSTNGTFVNERRVLGEPAKLMFGDTIRMGQSTFMLKIDQRRPL